jgi:hypothetical protein
MSSATAKLRRTTRASIDGVTMFTVHPTCRSSKLTTHGGPSSVCCCGDRCRQRRYEGASLRVSQNNQNCDASMRYSCGALPGGRGSSGARTQGAWRATHASDRGRSIREASTATRDADQMTEAKMLKGTETPRRSSTPATTTASSKRPPPKDCPALKSRKTPTTKTTASRNQAANTNTTRRTIRPRSDLQIQQRRRARNRTEPDLYLRRTGRAHQNQTHHRPGDHIRL